MKRVDPYHILYSPITGSTIAKAWYYQAATGPARSGAPAFDVYTFEHYELPGVGGGVATALQLQEYPLDFAPCWDMGEASGQRDGNFPAESPAELAVQDWVAFIGGGVRGQLWFDLSYSVNQQILEAASSVGTQLAYLAGGILSPVAVRQPVAASGADGVLARAFENGRGELFIAVVNERLAPVANISLSVVSADRALPLAAKGCRLSVPFEDSRVVTVAAASGLITEPLGSYAARVYRLESATDVAEAAASTQMSSGNNLVRTQHMRCCVVCMFLVTRAESRNPCKVWNSDFTAQTLPGTPDHWLLFPTAGTPAGGIDPGAVVLVDPAAARAGSNATAVMLIDPVLSCDAVLQRCLLLC